MRTIQNLKKWLLIAVSGVSPMFIQAQNLEVTYIANAGFLVTSGSHKVLFDGIFSEGSGKFVTPTSEDLIKERNATDPFNDIDLLFVSHVHVDHVNPEYLLEHMANNTKGYLLTQNQVVEQLKLQSSYAALHSRIKNISDTNRSQFDTLIENVQIKSFAFTHANNNPTIKNLGYLIKMDGYTIMHSGDSDPEILDTFKLYNLAKDSIDVLFLHRGFFDSGNSGTGIKIIKYLNPKAIFIDHIKVGDFDEYRDKLADITGIPPVYLIEGQMGQMKFAKEADSLVVVEDTSSVHPTGMASDEDLLVFPNPTNGQLTLTISDKVSGNGQLFIYHSDGQLVYSKPISNSSNPTIDLSGYSKGVYLLDYFDGDKSFTKKLLLR